MAKSRLFWQSITNAFTTKDILEAFGVWPRFVVVVSGPIVGLIAKFQQVPLAGTIVSGLLAIAAVLWLFNEVATRKLHKNPALSEGVLPLSGTVVNRLIPGPTNLETMAFVQWTTENRPRRHIDTGGPVAALRITSPIEKTIRAGDLPADIPLGRKAKVIVKRFTHQGFAIEEMRTKGIDIRAEAYPPVAPDVVPSSGTPTGGQVFAPIVTGSPPDPPKGNTELRKRLMDRLSKGDRLKHNAESIIGQISLKPTTEQDVEWWEDDVRDLLAVNPRWQARFMSDPPEIGLAMFAVSLFPLGHRIEHRLNMLAEIIKRVPETDP